MEPLELHNYSVDSECKITLPIKDALAPGEKALAAYQGESGNTFVITTKRFIFNTAPQTSGGKRVYNLPLSSISLYAISIPQESYLPNNLELWTRSGNMTIMLGDAIDTTRFSKLVSAAIQGVL